MSGIEHKWDKETWDGGLALCTVCGAGEGELLKWCPGFKLTPEARQACYTGNVADLDYFRSRREYEERQRAKER